MNLIFRRGAAQARITQGVRKKYRWGLIVSILDRGGGEQKRRVTVEGVRIDSGISRST
jgi:hypothetical protein